LVAFSLMPTQHWFQLVMRQNHLGVKLIKV
jgi:hypothetical protein